MSYEPRFYRDSMQPGKLKTFEIAIGESDLWIAADKELRDEALRILARLRQELKSYIAAHPDFRESYVPVEPVGKAPGIALAMMAAAKKAGVGPMAAVAGAFAEAVGRELLEKSREVIVENGGDIFIKTDSEKTISIYAGGSKLSGKVALVIKPEQMPLGICTSSGTVGPSFSFGKADAVVTVAKDTALADAYATAIGNRVKTEDDVEAAVEGSIKYEGLLGVVVICGDKLAARGEIELIPVSDN